MKPEEQARQQIDALLDAAIAADLKRAERLRQAILREAFAGRLVIQDPNDEPASALLERVRMVQQGRPSKDGKDGALGSLRSARISADGTALEQHVLWPISAVNNPEGVGE